MTDAAAGVQPVQSDPLDSSSGQSPKPNSTEAPSNLPANLQGKSAEELYKMHQELEKKLGEQSNEVKEARQLKQDMDEVLKTIWSDPELYRSVERKLLERQGKTSDLHVTDKKGDEGAKSKDDSASVPSDVRVATQNRVISEFEGKYKFNDMPAEQRKELNKKIATELAELRDPGGKKSIQQVIQEIPVDKLDNYLEKAYWLSVKDNLMEKGSVAQDFATIGSLSASSGKTDSGTGLSESEMIVAKKLRIDPKKYAERKKQINS